MRSHISVIRHRHALLRARSLHSARACALLTFLLSPLVAPIERWLGRIAAALLVVAIIFASTAAARWVLTRQLVDLAMDFLMPRKLTLEHLKREASTAAEGANAVNGLARVSALWGFLGLPRQGRPRVLNRAVIRPTYFTAATLITDVASVVSFLSVSDSSASVVWSSCTPSLSPSNRA